LTEVVSPISPSLPIFSSKITFIFLSSFSIR
jgi:hypothetical protein